MIVKQESLQEKKKAAKLEDGWQVLVRPGFLLKILVLINYMKGTVSKISKKNEIDP